MPKLLLTSASTDADSIRRAMGLPPGFIQGRDRSVPKTMCPNTPYLLGESLSDHDRRILSAFVADPGATRTLTELSLAYGGDNTVALAELTRKLRDYGLGTVGAATEVYGSRMESFGGTVKGYQDTLVAYRAALKTPAQAAARQRVVRAYANLQKRFGSELSTITLRNRARRGTALSRVDRALNIARDSRTATKLDVTSQVEASNLVRFARGAKYLGNGLAAIDFGSRARSIYKDYKAGGNWERKMFVESASFAVSTGAGYYATAIGMSALEFVVAATPLGWVGLVVGGLTVAGVAAAGSMGANNYLEKRMGSRYDEIMSWLSRI